MPGICFFDLDDVQQTQAKRIGTMVIRQKFKIRNDRVPGSVYIFHDTRSQLYKIGLSRSPHKRRYYLSWEYGTDLQVVAIVPTLNMLWTEELMHEVYKSKRFYRHPELNGYTEWFRFDGTIGIQICLWLITGFVTLVYGLVGIGTIGLIYLLLR